MNEENNASIGFTLIEMVVVLAVVAVLIGILVPQIVKHIRDSKISRAINEEQVISAAINMLYKDTGKWPVTNADGPSGRVDRLESGDGTVGATTQTAPGARDGAANWGGLSSVKYLQDYLYFNNPDNDTGPTNSNQSGQDYLSNGEYAWKGPYIDESVYLDPWGSPYVISARYFPGGTFSLQHRVLILSAGPDGAWSTAFSNSVTRYTVPDDSPYGPNQDGHDDIGFIILTNQ